MLDTSIEDLLTPHSLGPVLLTVQTAPIQPGSVAPWRGQITQTCWLSFDPGHVWRIQSSEGGKRTTLKNEFPLAVSEASIKCLVCLRCDLGLLCVKEQWLYLFSMHYDRQDQNHRTTMMEKPVSMPSFQFFFFPWPVRLLKTQRVKATRVGWEDCKAGWGWRSAHGCKRSSRNQVSGTPRLGSAEHTALWTPGEQKQYT